jgi:hypothetical protein
MAELIPDDRIVWAARRVAAELPRGRVELAVGRSVSVMVQGPKARQDQIRLVDTICADGKIVCG